MILLHIFTSPTSRLHFQVCETSLSPALAQIFVLFLLAFQTRFIYNRITELHIYALYHINIIKRFVNYRERWILETLIVELSNGSCSNPTRCLEKANCAIELNVRKVVRKYYNTLALRDCVKGCSNRISAAPTRREDIVKLYIVETPELLVPHFSVLV